MSEASRHHFIPLHFFLLSPAVENWYIEEESETVCICDARGEAVWKSMTLSFVHLMQYTPGCIEEDAHAPVVYVHVHVKRAETNRGANSETNAVHLRSETLRRRRKHKIVRWCGVAEEV